MFRIGPISLFLTFLGALSIGCATSLTEGGRRVEYLEQPQPPAECEYLGEVYAEDPNLGDLKVELRNEVGELGGNFLVIDSINEHDVHHGPIGVHVYFHHRSHWGPHRHPHWRWRRYPHYHNHWHHLHGVGKAYRCP